MPMLFSARAGFTEERRALLSPQGPHLMGYRDQALSLGLFWVWIWRTATPMAQAYDVLWRTATPIAL